MAKGKIKSNKHDDDDLLQCDCSACDDIRASFVDGKISKQKLTCIERLINFLRKIGC
jgi:hypothetical protein